MKEAMDKYLCKNRYRGTLVIYSFDEKPSYDPLLDYWDGEGKRILSFEEARPYLIEVQFHNSPYKIKIEK